MNSKPCPSCGAPIEADHPQGLCPACLLKKALDPLKPAGPTRVQCTVCGGTLGEDARFCASCGTPAPAAPVERDPLRWALEAKLKGQYRVVRLLGHGGMGAVYLARDLNLERDVAIKVIKTERDDTEVHERFRREARTVAKLTHPNIVPLHALGDIEGMPYFVMGFVRGESLATRLRRDGILPEEDARRILAEIADALDHAHRQGVIHRDIKPDNVLLEDESGRALLTDFGVAKALGKGGTLTTAGNVVGTPHYMSPEQATGRADLDGRSDIYSLGVMAYAMLAGRLPFEGNTPQQVLTKHLTQEPPPLRSLASTLSDATVQAVERCLAKEPAQRWQDARSLKLALGMVEEMQLPDALQAVDGKGIVLLGISVMLGLVLTLMHASLELPASSGILVALPFYLVIYIFLVAQLRRQGFSLGQSQQVIWQEPTWWRWWYPRALRRRGNVWNRLPRIVRYLRVSVAVFAVSNFSLCFFVALLGAEHVVLDVNVCTILASAMAWGFLTFRARRELKRDGLGPGDSSSVMYSIPPSRLNFWARPHIESILAPVSRSEFGQRSDSPYDQLRFIQRTANELSGPLRPLGAQATAAARQLLESIEHADREIAALARTHEPGEEARLADKIDALKTANGSSDEAAPMLLLLEKQLELIRELSARIERAREDRNRRIELLKTLALHLASLRARCTGTPTELRPLSDRVRTLCDEIAQRPLVQAETSVNVANITAATPPARHSDQ